MDKLYTKAMRRPCGIPLNGTHFFWEHMIAEMKCPFIKRDLFQKNPAHIPFLFQWEEVVRRSSRYDTNGG
jgi:hypothetical protein